MFGMDAGECALYWITDNTFPCQILTLKSFFSDGRFCAQRLGC